MIKEITRRNFMSVLTTGAATPFILGLDGCGGKGRDNGGDIYNTDSERVFSLSISSGDPIPSGVMLWTRIDPLAYKEEEYLYIQVSENERFLLWFVNPWLNQKKLVSFVTSPLISI